MSTRISTKQLNIKIDRSLLAHAKANACLESINLRDWVSNAIKEKLDRSGNLNNETHQSDFPLEIKP